MAKTTEAKTRTQLNFPLCGVGGITNNNNIVTIETNLKVVTYLAQFAIIYYACS